MAELIGIYGGTFDPVHLGHLRPALDVMQALELQQLRFVPNRQPPHRPQPWLDEVLRLRLLQLAIDEVPGFTLDTRELERDGPSYMVDTLTSLKQEFPDKTLCLIMGMDAFAGFSGWHDWQGILALSHLVVTTRPGAVLPPRGLMPPELLRCICTEGDRFHGAGGQILIQSVTQLDISATHIRRCLEQGKSIRFLVPETVRGELEQQYAIK